MKTPKKALAIAASLALATLAVVLLLVISDYFTPAEIQVDLNRPRFRLVRHRMILPDQTFEMNWTRINDWEFLPDEGPPIFGQRMSGARYSWEIKEPLGGMRFEEVLDYPEDYVVYQMNTRHLFKPNYPLRQAEAWATNR
jgi:hypothetical protein